MKKLLLFAAIAGIMLAGCDDKVDPNVKGISFKVTVTSGGKCEFYLTGTGSVTAKWGDGSSGTFTLLSVSDIMDLTAESYFYNDYASAGTKTVSLTGDYIEGLFLHQGQSIVSIDASRCSGLEQLWCIKGQLTSLDVSKNPNLKSLSCSENKLSSLDLSKNTALQDFWCDGNQLQSLDLSANTALRTVLCSENKLKTLDFSNHPALANLACDNNEITSITLGQHPNLMYFRCNENKLELAALTAIFNALPNRTGTDEGNIIVVNNPGVSNAGFAAAKAIATAKNWNVIDVYAGS